MSAFVVGTPHIDAMVTAGMKNAPRSDVGLTWYHDGGYKRLDYTTADEVGAMLIAENIKSVSFRYHGEDLETLPGPNDKSDLIDYTFHAVPTSNFNPVDVLGAISCYEYQTCEHDGWETSEAKAFCGALRDRMISLLPGYSDAPWEIQDRNLWRQPTIQELRASL